jgi:hypothetical protein
MTPGQHPQSAKDAAGSASETRERILSAVSDLVGALLYYDRKEDEDLPRGAIESAIESGVITYDEIVSVFRSELTGGESDGI